MEDGYVRDIEYVPGFYPYQAPAHLDTICLLNGLAPPDRGAAFTWCELGCGQGLTANLIAAAYPDATIHGIDYLPPHIDHARAMAEGAGITNAIFHPSSIADMADDPSLPLFDYITLHGVYSWVGPSVQADIVRFLERRLKPGGVVLVSYNSLPGWRRIAPLQRLLRAHAEAADTRIPSDRRVRDALAFAQALKAAGAGGLADTDMDAVAAPLPGRSEAQHAVYLAHEYLNADWRPLLHGDVAKDFAEAGLSYVGSARPFHNVPDMILTGEQRALLDGIADATTRESLVDYCTQTMLRYDIYGRGLRVLSAEERNAGLRAVRLALINLAVPLPHQINTPSRSLVLEPPVFGPILDALAQGVCTIGALLDLPALQGRTDVPTPADLLVILTGCEFAWACDRTPGEATPAMREFNRLQAVETLEGRHAVAAFAAAAGLGVAVEPAGAALYLLLEEGEDIPAAALPARIMQRLGEDGPMMATMGPAELQAMAARRIQLTQAAEGSIRLLPEFWRRLGCR